MKFSPSLKPGIWGAVIGATVISVLGFSLFGWTLDSIAEKMAKERALTAVVEVLAPICVPATGGCAGEIEGIRQGVDLGPTINH
jgi:hypothetical protein